MESWIKAALDYIPRWLDYQMRESEQPGCAIAVAHKGRVVLEQAFGHADAIRKRPLTPQHRFRVASHSKAFTAAGILRLREKDKLRLDDPVSRYVDGLHSDAAAATIGQLLSHSAGLIRDGTFRRDDPETFVSTIDGIFVARPQLWGFAYTETDAWVVRVGRFDDQVMSFAGDLADMIEEHPTIEADIRVANLAAREEEEAALSSCSPGAASRSRS